MQFVMPAFAQGGPAQPYANGPAYSEPPAFSCYPTLAKSSASFQSHSQSENMFSTSSPSYPFGSLPQPRRRQSDPSHQLDPARPICSLYGHSVQAVNPDLTDFPAPLSLSTPEEIPSPLASHFDPRNLGIQLPANCNYVNLYSRSGFDFMRALAYVVNRPNPQIDIGPVDTSTAFVVADARKPDLPIVFASASFSSLTGYDNSEIVGTNCRFLQSPRTAGPLMEGTIRKHSDQIAAFHMKAHIMAGKESQSSLINYRKNGEPFINLVTVIPITFGSDEVTYHIGFQVDMIEQKNAILSQKASGTYMTHHNMSTQVEHRIVPVAREPLRIQTIDPPPPPVVNPPSQPVVRARPSLQIPGQLSNPRITSAFSDANSTRQHYKTLLDENHDLVMVVSLKGTLFYVSAACQKMLGYEQEDLVNQNISIFCHPGDITGVLRQLKEAGNTAHTPMDLIFRAMAKDQRKFWMEAQGQLHVEAGKGRKYVVLVGRERVLGPLSWKAIQSRGGLSDREFWTKLSLDGMCLHSTASVKEVLGYTSDTLLGMMLCRLAPEVDQPNILKAIHAAWHGTSVVTLAHSLINQDGMVIECISDFHSPRSGSSLPPFAAADSAAMSASLPTGSGAPPVIYCQIIEADSARRRASTVLPPSPTTRLAPSNQGSSINQRSHPSLVSASDRLVSGLPNAMASTSGLINPKDNLFSELDTSRTTAWNFELSELKIRNKALRAELTARRQQRKPSLSNDTAKQVRSTGAQAASTPLTQPATSRSVSKIESPDRSTPLQSNSRSGCGGCGRSLGKFDNLGMSDSKRGFCELTPDALSRIYTINLGLGQLSTTC